MIKGGNGLKGAGKVRTPDAIPYKPNPLEIAGAVRKLSGDVNSPLPLILLDTAQTLMSDKSVIVTPITRQRVEGVQRIVEPITIDGTVDVNVVSAKSYVTAGWDFSYGNGYTLYTAPNGYASIELYGVAVWCNSGCGFGLTDENDNRITPDGLLLTDGTFFTFDFGGEPLYILPAGSKVVLKTDSLDPQSFGLLYIRLIA